MKNSLLVILILLALSACHQQTDNTQFLQKQIDSLQNKLADSYKPGFGDFMSSIQVHHAKLWFAGKNENWKLADFELHEIMETIEDIQKYQSERTESAMLPQLNAALDVVGTAVKQRNGAMFKASFTNLTNSCNNCHRQTNHEFNVVKIPDSPPFSNQVFNK
jgi:hypothetical protein